MVRDTLISGILNGVWERNYEPNMKIIRKTLTAMLKEVQEVNQKNNTSLWI